MKQERPESPPNPEDVLRKMLSTPPKSHEKAVTAPKKPKKPAP